MEEYGGNGFIRDDAGNGSAGPAWIEWDEEMEAEVGDVEMEKTALEDVAKIARYVVRDYDISGGCFVSGWIYNDKDPGATNPYRYRIIF